MVAAAATIAVVYPHMNSLGGETMGHAGALLRHADGRLEGGADPRSDGTAALLW